MSLQCFRGPKDRPLGLSGAFICREDQKPCSWRNGRVYAYADQCRACGLCVKACPERAIKLVKV
ncbi:4Fe-4S binding protein [Brytella acorum]|uniref:4Fe-4S binding protein n=1 Tax=Brytella acorum TaxID=2959299 RepID=UPI0037427A65